MRLDIYLTENGLESTRTRAKNLITSGSVSVNNKTVTKPSYDVEVNDTVQIIGERLKYVGRGGLKLEKALEHFNINVSGYNCLDIGASTGGFTDCLLQSGASHVYCVDVGTSQLADKISNDKRVTVLENTDARELNSAIVPYLCDFSCFDVSFISLTKVVPSVLPFIKDGGKVVALIKPQFEAGRENIGKNGVVTNPKVHKKVIDELTSFFISLGLEVNGCICSPIKGGDGNTEYLMFLTKQR